MTVAGAAFLFQHKPVVPGPIVLPATLLLLLVTASTTRGGWRWRWGGND